MKAKTNILIADFMQLKKAYKQYCSNDLTGGVLVYEIFINKTQVQNFTPEELPYSYNWDSLMAVVERIEALNYEFNIHTGCWVTIVDGDPNKCQSNVIIEISEKTKILTVYTACADFIEWYSTQAKF